MRITAEDEVAMAAMDVNWPLLASLDGLIPEEVGRVLAVAASTVPAELAIVELGSYRGKSTSYLAAGAKAGLGARVWAVDAWDLAGNEAGRHGYDRARNYFDAQLTVAGVARQVTAVQGFSVEVAQGWVDPPVGLLYIDADHTFDGVWADFWSWWPRMAPGGVVAFDDYETPRNPGVKRAVDRIARGGHFERWEVLAGRLMVARLAPKQEDGR